MTTSKNGVLLKAVAGALSAVLLAAFSALWVYAAAIAADQTSSGRCIATNTEAIHRIDEKHRDDMHLLRDEMKLMREELVRIRQEQAQTTKTLVGVLTELKAKN